VQITLLLTLLKLDTLVGVVVDEVCSAGSIDLTGPNMSPMVWLTPQPDYTAIFFLPVDLFAIWVIDAALMKYQSTITLYTIFKVDPLLESYLLATKLWL